MPGRQKPKQQQQQIKTKTHNQKNRLRLGLKYQEIHLKFVSRLILVHIIFSVVLILKNE